MDSNQSESAFAGLGRSALVDRMHNELDDLLAARDQMEQLLHAIVGIGTDLDLDATLHRIIAEARELTGARYGALGVWGADGTLVSFLHDGIDEDTAGRIGRLPAGKGVLGLPLDSEQVLRLEDLTAHPGALGFPEHHPPMHAFLGVPITIRQAPFGSLYLTNPQRTRTFTESDEIAVRALATAAAVAIDNAQLFERIRAAAEWARASREITTALLSGVDSQVPPLQMIADYACRLCDAEQAILLVPTDAELPNDEISTLVVSTAVGLHAGEVIGQLVPVDGSTTGAVFRSGIPQITETFRHPIESFTDLGERPAIVMPLRAEHTVAGVIAVARNQHQPPFDSSYLELVSDFAGHAAVALTLANAREHLRELTVLADRERIAHDLHDHVIQRLFAAGMNLQGTIARSHSPEVTQRLNRTVDDLQTTIEDIRTTIFHLQSPYDRSGDFRQRIQGAIAALTEDRDIAATLHMSGPMTAIADELAAHAEAVVTEAVSNTVRHSGATRVFVDITVADDFAVVITDDGRGIPADNQRRSGLANLHRRAQTVGASCHVTSAPHGGTTVRWIAPLTQP